MRVLVAMAVVITIVVAWHFGAVPAICQVSSLAQTTTQPPDSQSATLTAKPDDRFGTVLDRLSTLTLAIAAFLAAFYTLLRNNSSIRPEAGGVFYAMASCVLAGTAFLAGYIVPPTLSKARQISFELGGLFFLLTLALFIRVMWRSYVRMNFLHEGPGSGKFFILVRWWRWLLPRRKSYEFDIIPRKSWRQESGSLLARLPSAAFSTLNDGGSLLIKTDDLSGVRAQLLAFVADRIKAEDTVNYVTFTVPPDQILTSLQAHLDPVPPKQFVFIDGYSQTFGFHDDIVRERTVRVKDTGIEAFNAKTCAGIHAALKQAFNFIKGEGDGKKKKRRPCLMIYDSLSALALVDSDEQVRLFLHHMIPSERSYKMLTVLIEHSKVNEDVLHTMEGLVDVVIAEPAPHDSVPTGGHNIATDSRKKDSKR